MAPNTPTLAALAAVSLALLACSGNAVPTGAESTCDVASAEYQSFYRGNIFWAVKRTCLRPRIDASEGSTCLTKGDLVLPTRQDWKPSLQQGYRCVWTRSTTGEQAMGWVPADALDQSDLEKPTARFLGSLPKKAWPEKAWAMKPGQASGSDGPVTFELVRSGSDVAFTISEVCDRAGCGKGTYELQTVNARRAENKWMKAYLFNNGVHAYWPGEVMETFWIGGSPP